MGDAIPSHEDEFEEFMIVRILLALGRTRGLAERSLRVPAAKQRRVQRREEEVAV